MVRFIAFLLLITINGCNMYNQHQEFEAEKQYEENQYNTEIMRKNMEDRYQRERQMRGY